MLRDTMIKLLGGFTKAEFYQFATKKTEEANSTISLFMNHLGKVDVANSIRNIHKVSVNINAMVNGREMPQEVVKKEMARMLIKTLLDEGLITVKPLTGEGLIGEKFVNAFVEVIEPVRIIETSEDSQEAEKDEE